MRTFKTLKSFQYYDIFRERKVFVDVGSECGTKVASNIIIPVNESSIEEDYANGLLSMDSYITLMISKGYITEIDGVWILETGVWNGNGVWLADGIWNGGI